MAVLMLFCVLPLGSFASDVKVPEDAVEFNGNYYKVYEENKKWTEAEAWCEEQGGHLVTITSAEEQAFIERIITGDKTNIYWIGLRLDTVPQAWVTNESLSYTNWSENNPDHRVDGEVYVNIYGKDHIVYGKTWQKKGQWNDLTDSATSGEGTDVDFYQLSKTGFICEWEKSTPVGYDFYKDSYNFTNENWYISKKYFTNWYGLDAGNLLYKNLGGYSDGCCFGMAYTTALFYNSKPDVTSIIVKPRISEDTCSNLRDALSLSEVDIGGEKISVLDYIKYSHIYQYSSVSEKNSVWTDISTIYNVVKSYLDNDSIGVTIGMTRNDGNGGHRVLAVGIDGNDILVDDPNNSSGFERITVGENNYWSFSGLPGWNSDTCRIRYSSDIYVPYEALLSGKAPNKKNTSGEEKYVTGMDSLAKDNLLLTVSNSNSEIDSNDIIEINSDDYVKKSDKTVKLYWLLNDKSISVSNTGGEENEVCLAGNGSILTASVSDKSDVTMTIDAQKTETKINAVPGNTYTVSVIRFNDEEEAVEIKVSGTAAGKTVTASKTDTGVVVSGLNNITIKYIKDDVEISDAKADVPDGREVNISVDEKSGNIETDFKTESPAEDQTENACPFCGKVHGKGFIERVIAFFHMIFAFFKKLFHR